MKSRTLGIILGSTLAALLIGCAQAPEQEMHHARSALETTKNAGAEQYAYSALKAAEISYELAMKQVSEENRKLPFMRKYNKISEMLASSVAASEGAQAEVVRVKSRLREETKEMIGTTRSLADSAEIILQASSRKKSADSLLGDLEAVRVGIKDAEGSLSTENFLLAREKASLLQEKTKSLLTMAQKLPSAKKPHAKKK